MLNLPHGAESIISRLAAATSSSVAWRPPRHHLFISQVLSAVHQHLLPCCGMQPHKVAVAVKPTMDSNQDSCSMFVYQGRGLLYV
jgi:hypothetical protein